MNKYFKFFLLICTVSLLGACKTEFEKIRNSGNFELMYKQAEEYYAANDFYKAQVLYEQVLSGFRGRNEAEDVYYKYAQTHFQLEKYILAAYYFKNFAQTFSTSNLREDADFMAAYANYKLSPTYRLDQQYTQEAIDGFQLFVNSYPDSDKVEECNTLIDNMRAKLEQKAFSESKLYMDLGQYQSAISSFENVLKDFPDSPNTERIRYLVVESAFSLAENSFERLQLERFEDVITRATYFKNSFGKKSSFNKEINRIISSSKKEIKTLSNVGYQK